MKADRISCPPGRSRGGRVLVVTLIAVLSFSSAAGMRDISVLVLTAGASICATYVFCRFRARAREVRVTRQLEFHLPLLMERIVMAVESGLDIIPAVGVILELEQQERTLRSSPSLNPVTVLLEKVYDLSQAGVPFEKALSETALRSNCGAVRHAFVHLGLAHREGGEVMGPLRELSDATQLYYQETIELEIAALPAKATLPLVLTFAGLIILFISTPLVQISSITRESTPHSGGVHAFP